MAAFVVSSSTGLRCTTFSRGSRMHTSVRTNTQVTPRMSLESSVSRRQFGLSMLTLSLIPTFPTLTKAATSTETTQSLSKAARKFERLVADVIKRDPTMAATFLRLSFHDSFTFDTNTGKGGANGSIRLETEREENAGLIRAVEALDPIVKLSGLGWADAVALAGAIAVRETGGPNIKVSLGRATANEEDPRGALPPPTETVEEMRKRFIPRGFDDRDIVALSGAHTLGRVGGSREFVRDANKFRNDFFVNLMWFQNQRENGLPEDEGPPEKPNFQLPSDLNLINDPRTLPIVREFANDEKAFFDAFAKSYNRMVAVGTARFG